MPKKLIIANWKMNPQTVKEAESIFGVIGKYTKGLKNSKVIICPPNLFISNLKKKSIKNLIIGAQNLFFEKIGAFTGEISAPMLVSIGVNYAIIGHSERRVMGETNEIISKKILTSLKFNIIPILCIGEKERDHSGDYLHFIKKQIGECLFGVSKSQVNKILFAYEPVWAIGKDAKREATPDEFIETSIFIRKIISDLYDTKIAHDIKIIYGGSVSSKNAENFLNYGKADGLLVGGASIKPIEFYQIIKCSEKLYENPKKNR